MSENRIGLIYSEVNFADLYKNLPPFDEFFKYMRESQFLLVAIFKMYYIQEVAGWADALFVNKALLDTKVNRQL